MDGRDCSVATVCQMEEPASSFSFACHTVGSDASMLHWQLVAPSPTCTTTSPAYTRARRREAMFPSQGLTPQLSPQLLFCKEKEMQLAANFLPRI